MKTDDGNEKLKRMFESMRIEDGAKTPDFITLVPEKVAHVSHFPWRIAAAAALVILVGVIFLNMNMTRSTVSREDSYEKWSALSGWKAYTDGILNTEGTRMQSSLTRSTDVLLSEITEDGKTN